MSAAAEAYYQERAARLPSEAAQRGIAMEPVQVPQYLDGLPILLSGDGRNDGAPMHMAISAESTSISSRFAAVLGNIQLFLMQATRIYWPGSPLDPDASRYRLRNSTSLRGLVHTGLGRNDFPTGRVNNIQMEAITPDEVSAGITYYQTAHTRISAHGEAHTDAEAYFLVSGTALSGSKRRIVSCITILALEAFQQSSSRRPAGTTDPPSTHIIVPHLMIRRTSKQQFATPAAEEARRTRPYYDPWGLSRRSELVIPLSGERAAGAEDNPPNGFVP